MALETTSVSPRLQGRRAIVTGASRGIGRATVERLLAEGARVAALDVDGGAVDGALGLCADVSDEDAVAAAFAQAVDAFGGLDVVVANAAIQLVGEDDRADRLDRQVWQRTLDANLARQDWIFVLYAENSVVANVHVSAHDVFPGARTMPVADGAECV